jgi:hypothetical protein
MLDVAWRSVLREICDKIIGDLSGSIWTVKVFILQDSEIDLPFQQAAKRFSLPFTYRYSQLRPPFLSRSSHRGAIVFVSQAKQMRNNLGFAVFISSPFRLVLDITRYSHRFCLFFQ